MTPYPTAVMWMAAVAPATYARVVIAVIGAR